MMRIHILALVLTLTSVALTGGAVSSTADIFTAAEQLALRERVLDTRCHEVHNDTCVGVYEGSACEGPFVEYRCRHGRSFVHPDGERRGRAIHEPRALCLPFPSFTIVGWQMVAASASTPTNWFATTSDTQCETQCNVYRSQYYYVEGWNRFTPALGQGTCQCFVKPYGFGSPNSIILGPYDVGFYKNTAGPSTCGSYTIDAQKIWSTVTGTVTASNINACLATCFAYGTWQVATLYKPGNNCFCLNGAWLNPVQTYDSNWGSGLNFRFY